MSLIDNSADPDERLKDWVRQWPAKQVACDIGAEVRTVHSWRQGQWPAGQHLKAMVARWGRPFLDFIFPAPDAAALRREALILARAQVDLERLRQERDHHEAARRTCPVERLALAGMCGDAVRLAGHGRGLSAPVRRVAFQGWEG